MTILLLLAAATAAPPANSRAAALASIRTEFREMDTNHDGVLTRAEVKNRIAHMKVAAASHDLTPQQINDLTDLWFARSDTNHDGKITLKEAEGTMLAVFNRYDTNHDGVISPQERADAVARETAQRSQALQGMQGPQR